jgi:flagellar hook-associated protein 3 FlgL
MRVTTSMLFNNQALNINRSREAYVTAQEALITNKKINRPSDDPVGASRVSNTRNMLGRIEQFTRNIGYARNFVTQMESALTAVGDDLQRVRELAVSVNDGTVGVDEYQAAADEVAGLFTSILAQANARDDRRFIFAGYSTLSTPFDAAGAYSGGVNQDIEVEVSDGNFVTLNMDGQEVFKAPTDVFQVLTDLQTAIAAGDQTQISALMSDIESALEQVVRARAGIGAVSTVIDRAESQNLDMEELMTKVLSETEDSDIAAATSAFAVTEQVYQSTLLVSSRVMSLSLLDYIG